MLVLCLCVMVSDLVFMCVCVSCVFFPFDFLKILICLGFLFCLFAFYRERERAGSWWGVGKDLGGVRRGRP